MGPRRDHELVVAESGAVGEVDDVRVGVDPLDHAGELADPDGDQADSSGLDDLLGPVGAEGDEQVAGLVVVFLGLVDDGDLPFVGRKQRAELVDDHRAGGAGAEDQKVSHGRLLTHEAVGGERRT
jgi:hypothetical protein